MFDLIPFGSRFFAGYDPFRELDKEFEAMERRMLTRTAPSMKTDIRETEGAYVLEADLPGFSKEDLAIKIKDDVLTIRAERKKDLDEKDKEGNYLRRERSYTSFERRFDLTGIRAEEITAAYRDGVLTLTLPKAAPPKVDEGRTVEIE